MELLQASLSNDVSLNKNEREKVASLLASGLSAVEHYPASLRKQILPAAAEFVSRYGSSAALGALIRCANIPEENLACAISASRRKDVTASAQLSKLEDDPDSHVWSGAREERVLSEQKAGKIAPDKAAEMLDNLIPAARLSDREKEVRLEELDAVLAAGNLQKAQSLIDEWGQIYPKCDADILPRKLVLATLLGKNSTGGDLGARIGFLKNTLEHVSSQSERNELLKSLAAQYEALGLAGQAVDVFRSLLPQLPNSEQADTRIKMASLELSTGGRIRFIRILPRCSAVQRLQEVRCQGVRRVCRSKLPFWMPRLHSMGMIWIELCIPLMVCPTYVRRCFWLRLLRHGRHGQRQFQFCSVFWTSKSQRTDRSSP